MEMDTASDCVVYCLCTVGGVCVPLSGTVDPVGPLRGRILVLVRAQLVAANWARRLMPIALLMAHRGVSVGYPAVPTPIGGRNTETIGSR